MVEIDRSRFVAGATIFQAYYFLSMHNAIQMLEKVSVRQPVMGQPTMWLFPICEEIWAEKRRSDGLILRNTPMVVSGSQKSNWLREKHKLLKHKRLAQIRRRYSLG